MINSLRLRLTLWYLAFFLLLLSLFSFFLHSRLARALEERLDERIAAEAATAASLFVAELEELKGDVPAAAQETIYEMRPQGVVLAFLDDRRLLAQSAPAPSLDLISLVAPSSGRARDWVVALPRAGRRGARAAVHRFMVNGASYLAVAVESVDSIADGLQGFRGLLYVSLPLLLALAGLGGYVVAARSLAPLRSMTRQAGEISGSNLDRRLEVGPAVEELALLATSFNALLSRLDQSFETMRRFVADASHELRTPLAVLRGEAELALAKDRTAAEYRDALAVIQDESRRLGRLVEDLLNLARADAGRVNLRLQDLYLDDLVGECCRAVAPLAEARGVAVTCRPGADVAYRGDEELLRRMVLNLLDNAVRYTPAGGRVSVSLEIQDPSLLVRVEDTGIGITEEAAPHIFERFYRADKARSREEGGFGLGLSIVKWIAELHRGTVEMHTSPGAGSTFSVRLPR